MEQRKIQCRAWDPVEKVMYYPEFPFIGAGGGARDIAIMLNGRVITPNSYGFDSMIYPKEETPELIVMLDTGKKDKNGTKIYDGDITEFDREEWGGNDNIHQVSWDNEGACWSWGGGSTRDMEFRKVIGNIYQNPEIEIHH